MMHQRSGRLEKERPVGEAHLDDDRLWTRGEKGIVKRHLIGPYRACQRAAIQFFRKRNPKLAFLLPSSVGLLGLLFAKRRELWIGYGG